VTACRVPCPTCPWRVDKDASTIPNFDLELAERLVYTSPDDRGMGPEYGAPIFACHQSKPEQEVVCSGWLAVVGDAHPNVRLGVIMGKIPVEALKPQPGWPRLHTNFRQVMEKLRRTGNPEALAVSSRRSVGRREPDPPRGSAPDEHLTA
jgi:hypothetical protein